MLFEPIRVIYNFKIKIFEHLRGKNLQITRFTEINEPAVSWIGMLDVCNSGYC